MDVPGARQVGPGYAVTGVVHEHVDLQAACLELGMEPRRGVGALEILDDQLDASTVCLLEARLHRAQPLLPARRDDDIEAFGGEDLGKRLADAGRAAGD